MAKAECERLLLLADLTKPDKPVVIIATPIMLKWADTYGHERPVSIDCTFGLNRYGFSVCTLTALNGRGRGVPICVAVMGSESGETFALVITELKKRLRPDWRPSIVLADAAEAEHIGVRYVRFMCLRRTPLACVIMVKASSAAQFFYWAWWQQEPVRVVCAAAREEGGASVDVANRARYETADLNGQVFTPMSTASFGQLGKAGCRGRMSKEKKQKNNRSYCHPPAQRSAVKVRMRRACAALACVGSAPTFCRALQAQSVRAGPSERGPVHGFDFGCHGSCQPPPRAIAVHKHHAAKAFFLKHWCGATWPSRCLASFRAHVYCAACAALQSKVYLLNVSFHTSAAA
jgi:MULE transposase domain